MIYIRNCKIFRPEHGQLPRLAGENNRLQVLQRVIMNG